MKNLFKQLSILRSEKLSLREREAMRADLLHRMEMYTVHYAAQKGRPYSWGKIRTHHKQIVGLAFISLFSIFSGASLAAASSLPGDILYPIKIHVNERIEGAFVISPKATAEFAQKQIIRRAVEAEILTKENRLDEEKRDQLANETKTHVDSYTDARLQVEHKGNRGDVEELEGNMESTIRDHERALSDMGVAVVVATSTDNTKGVRTLLRGHRAQKDESFRRPFVYDEVKDESLSEVSLPPSTNKEGRGESSLLQLRKNNSDSLRADDSSDYHAASDKSNTQGGSFTSEQKSGEEGKIKINPEED